MIEKWDGESDGEWDTGNECGMMGWKVMCGKDEKWK